MYNPWIIRVWSYPALSWSMPIIFIGESKKKKANNDSKLPLCRLTSVDAAVLIALGICATVQKLYLVPLAESAGPVDGCCLIRKFASRWLSPTYENLVRMIVMSIAVC